MEEVGRKKQDGLDKRQIERYTGKGRGKKDKGKKREKGGGRMDETGQG